MITKHIVLIITLFCLSYIGCVNMKKPQEKHSDIWWRSYKKNFILPVGRVQRPEHDFDTVSEGQAYAMLFSVFMDDKKTFDLIFDWTEKHLSRTNKNGDYLLAWHWKEGNVRDWMPASDADCDYALALLTASHRWKETTYYENAVQVLNDILKNETANGANNRLFLLPGKWGNEKNGCLVQNPSYYSPAAFRLFYKTTQDKRWLDLAETGYWLLDKSGNHLDNTTGYGLIPDWCTVDSSGNILTAEDRSNDYGWEAIRVPMRIGLDMLWYKTEKAEDILKKIHYTLHTSISDSGEIKAVYCYSGKPAVEYGSLAANAMACFTAQLLNQKIDKSKTSITSNYAEQSSVQNYYGQSLSFFPLGFEDGILEKPK